MSELKCNDDCFNCPYPDCIADSRTIRKNESLKKSYNDPALTAKRQKQIDYCKHYHQKYYQEHKQKIQENQKKYYPKYYEKNKELIREKNNKDAKEYYKNHKDEILANANKRYRVKITNNIIDELKSKLKHYKKGNNPYHDNINAGLSLAIQVMENGLKRLESEER